MRRLCLVPLLTAVSLVLPASSRGTSAAPRLTAASSAVLPCLAGMRCKAVHRQICGVRFVKRPSVRRRDAGGCTAYAIDLDFRLAYGKSRADVAPGSLSCLVRRPPAVDAACHVENNGGAAYGYVGVVTRIDAPRQVTGLAYGETLYVTVYAATTGRISARVSVP